MTAISGRSLKLWLFLVLKFPAFCSCTSSQTLKISMGEALKVLRTPRLFQNLEALMLAILSATWEKEKHSLPRSCPRSGVKRREQLQGHKLSLGWMAVCVQLWLPVSKQYWLQGQFLNNDAFCLSLPDTPKKAISGWLFLRWNALSSL